MEREPEVASTSPDAPLKAAVQVAQEPESATRRRRRRGGGAAPDGGDGGNVGQQIYAEVNRIIDAEGIRKSDAFKRVGEAQGRQPGTVAANYYRVARKEGSGRVTSRSRRGSASGARGRRRGSDVGAVITQLQGALAELGRAIRDQEREIARLQEENAQFGELRTLIARTTSGTRRGRRTK